MRLNDSRPFCKLLHFYSANRLGLEEWRLLLVVEILITTLAHGGSGWTGWFKSLMTLFWYDNLVIEIVILFLKTNIFLNLLLVLANLVGLEIVNHFKDVGWLLARNFCFHPLHNHTCRIDALYLLKESSIDFTSIVASWPDSNIVDVHLTNHIFACASRVLTS